jgi:hypothetical protein
VTSETSHCAGGPGPLGYLINQIFINQPHSQNLQGFDGRKVGWVGYLDLINLNRMPASQKRTPGPCAQQQSTETEVPHSFHPSYFAFRPCDSDETCFPPELGPFSITQNRSLRAQNPSRTRVEPTRPLVHQKQKWITKFILPRIPQTVPLRCTARPTVRRAGAVSLHNQHVLPAMAPLTTAFPYLPNTRAMRASPAFVRDFPRF